MLGLPFVGGAVPVDAAVPDGCGPFTAVVANHAGDSVSIIDLPLASAIAVGRAPVAAAVTPDGRRVLVVNKVGGTLSEIEVTTGAVSATFSAGVVPNAVAVTPDGSKALVVSSTGTVSVVDLTASPPVVSATISTPGTAYGVAITRDGARALVTADAVGGRVYVVDLRASPPVVSSTVDVGVAPSPQGIAITPDGSTAFVVGQRSNQVGVIDLAASPPVVSSTLSTGSLPEAVVVTPDGATAFVAHQSGGVSTITVSGLTVGGPVAVGSKLTGIAANDTTVIVTDQANDTVAAIDIATLTVTGASAVVGDTPSSVAVTPDGSKAFVTNLYGNSVSEISMRSLQRIGLGAASAPQGVAVTPDGAKALVTNEGTDSVAVVDIATRSVLGAAVAVGDDPFGVAVTSDGSTALVTNQGSGTVSVVDLAAAPPAVRSTVRVGSAPRGVAITPDGTRALVANSGDDNLSVLDLTVSPPVEVKGSPVTLAGVPFGVAIAPTGKQAYVSVTGSSSSDRVSVIDLTVSPPVLAKEILFPLGTERPTGISVASDGTVYVAEADASSLGELTPSGNGGRVQLPSGSRPSGVGVAPDAQSVLVADSASDTVLLVTRLETLPATVVALGVGDAPAGIAFAPAECRAPTTTTITGDSPDPSVAGSRYTVTGTVTVDRAGTVTALPGSVTVTGEGSGCVDSRLTPTENPNEFAFSCTVTAGAEEGAATLTATHVDSGNDYATSSDTEGHGVISAELRFTG